MENVQGKCEQSRGDSRVRRHLNRPSVRAQDLRDLKHDVIVRAAERKNQLRKRTALQGWLRAIEKDLSRRYWPACVQPSKQTRRQKDLRLRPKQIGTKWITVDGQRHLVRVFEPGPRVEEPQRQLRFVVLSDSSILKASRSNRPNYACKIDFWQKLANLQKRWAMALLLRYAVGCTAAQTAEILDCTVQRVYRLVQLAKRRMRELLPSYDHNGLATLQPRFCKTSRRAGITPAIAISGKIR